MSPPAVPPRGGWLPIASAPKDGTRVLLYLPVTSLGEHVYSGSYQIDARTGAEGWGAATPIGWRNVTPTHWQPLPAPPSDEPDVSPELRDHPPRERVEAERDIAVAAINTIRFKGSPHETWARSIADSAAAKIAALRGQEPPR